MFAMVSSPLILSQQTNVRYATGKNSDLGDIKSKFPTDISYISAAIPRINDLNLGSSSILKDIVYIINQKGIRSGEFGFNNTTYSDIPSGVDKWGYIQFFQHADNYVTVILYPETSLNTYYRRLNITNNTWEYKWWKTQLVEVN